MKLFFYYSFVPALMVIVALIQSAYVHKQGLTRWKGGGFGMYSEFHHNKKLVIFRSNVGRLVPIEPELQKFARKARIMCAQRSLQAISSDIYTTTNRCLGIEVWMPMFDVHSLEMTRVPISVYYPDRDACD